MTSYRTFRNWDPPALVELWNASVSGRGAARDIEVQDLDRLIFSKPYFDPTGIILAEEGNKPVGFVHAGFGAATDDSGLSHGCGVIAMLVVAPNYRRRGVGRELVHRAEAYLRASGSRVIHAGGLHPLDSFYLGLYGGSEMPGILRSDAVAHQLFQSLGYRPVDECLVFQRSLERPLMLTDPRARSWAREVEFRVELQPQPQDWWSACRYGSLDNTGFQLQLRSSELVVAQAVGWEIYPLEKTWGADAVGIVALKVHPDYRKRGLGTFLLTQILRHYRAGGLALAEVQTIAHNQVAQRLCLRLGFEEVDRGVVYRAPSPSQ